jgi:hypothetical protein
MPKEMFFTAIRDGATVAPISAVRFRHSTKSGRLGGPQTWRNSSAAATYRENRSWLCFRPQICGAVSQMFRATGRVLTIARSPQSFNQFCLRTTDQLPTQSALLTANWRGCEGGPARIAAPCGSPPHLAYPPSRTRDEGRTAVYINVCGALSRPRIGRVVGFVERSDNQRVRSHFGDFRR